MVTHDKCADCIHETVCGFKREYEAVCDVVKRSHYPTKSPYPTLVYDLPVPVTIQCPHIMPKTDSDTAGGNEPKFHIPQMCACYSTNGSGEPICMGTKELDPCKGPTCERWRRRE